MTLQIFIFIVAIVLVAAITYCLGYTHGEQSARDQYKPEIDRYYTLVVALNQRINRLTTPGPVVQTTPPDATLEAIGAVRSGSVQVSADSQDRIIQKLESWKKPNAS